MAVSSFEELQGLALLSVEVYLDTHTLQNLSLVCKRFFLQLAKRLSNRLIFRATQTLWPYRWYESPGHASVSRVLDGVCGGGRCAIAPETVHTVTVYVSTTRTSVQDDYFRAVRKMFPKINFECMEGVSTILWRTCAMGKHRVPKDWNFRVSITATREGIKKVNISCSPNYAPDSTAGSYVAKDRISVRLPKTLTNLTIDWPEKVPLENGMFVQSLRKMRIWVPSNSSDM